MEAPLFFLRTSDSFGRFSVCSAVDRLTGLCPGGWVSYGRSAPEQGPVDCAPIWSWPHYWLGSAPSETRTQLCTQWFTAELATQHIRLYERTILALVTCNGTTSRTSTGARENACQVCTHTYDLPAIPRLLASPSVATEYRAHCTKLISSIMSFTA